jgi:E3 ubiquitin-protein ligase SIAH1
MIRRPSAKVGASNMQSQFTSVEENLLRQLECPVCMEYMRPPITLCANGHNICNICKENVPHCPTCRGQFLNIRNVALENVAIEAEYPCVYRKYGCTEIYKLDSIGRHQEKCQYIPQPCPVIKLNLGTCTWTGISSNMKSHLMDEHTDISVDYYDRGSGVYSGRPFQISGVTPTTKRCKFISAHNALFYSCSEIKNDIFYSVVQYIGPDADAANYKYKLEFVNQECEANIAVTLLVRSLNEDLNEVHNSGNCVILHPKQYNRFASFGNELRFSLEIFTTVRMSNYVYRVK